MGPLKTGQQIAWGGRPGQGVKKRGRQGHQSGLFKGDQNERHATIVISNYRYVLLTSRKGDSMPRGASPKRERHYETIKQSAKKTGRYGARAEEVAARTVNKIRREKGETKAQRSGSKKSSVRTGSNKPKTAKPRATKSRPSSKSPARTS